MDQEVTNRTKDRIYKHKTVVQGRRGHDMENDEEDDDERVQDDGLAIPDYGGEDIDEEDDEDYGSSQGGNSVLEQRLQELQDEIAEKTNNIVEAQLDEILRDKLSQMEKNISEIKDRYPQQTSYQSIMNQLDQIVNDILVLRSHNDMQIDSIHEMHGLLQKTVEADKEYITTEMMIMEKKLKKEDAELHHRIDSLQEYIREIEYKVESMKGKDSSVEGLLISLIELAHIDITLMEADEQDKRNISLMGVKDEITGQMSPSKQYQNNQVVQLDKTCLSCSNQSYKIISAFKMACLTYFPNSVKY